MEKLEKKEIKLKLKLSQKRLPKKLILVRKQFIPIKEGLIGGCLHFRNA